jgi:DNA-binding response OmpR family regulator
VNKRKVLIVDDDPQIRKILERMLEGDHYEVQCVEDGTKAVERCLEFRPHLVILDIMMPGKSGIEVCQEIRNHFSKEKIQVLMLSAKDSQSDRRQALEFGADDYVTKPFHIASLGRKIEYFFSKRDPEGVVAS